MSDLVFFCHRACPTSRLIPIIGKFLDTKDLKITYLEDLTHDDQNRVLSKSPTKTFPVLRIDEFYLSGTFSIAKYILSTSPTLNDLLYGKSLKKRALNDMWVNFFSYNILPIADEIIGQITGFKSKDENIFAIAIGELMQELVKIDKHLTFKTFFVGYKASFADVVLATILHPLFTFVLSQELRQNIPNLLRHFTFMMSIKEISSVTGRARLCEVTQKPADTSNIPVISLTASTMSATSDKAQGKKQTKDKKPNQSKIEEGKPKKEEKDEKDGDEKEIKVTSKNPLDNLPPSPLILDDFKKEFLNTKEKKASLEKLWQKFDANGYSLWFLHYNKSPDQGKIIFRTKNLKGNFLQVS
jgi:elongation factor 1-gamma